LGHAWVDRHVRQQILQKPNASCGQRCQQMWLWQAILRENSNLDRAVKSSWTHSRAILGPFRAENTCPAARFLPGREGIRHSVECWWWYTEQERFRASESVVVYRRLVRCCCAVRSLALLLLRFCWPPGKLSAERFRGRSFHVRITKGSRTARGLPARLAGCHRGALLRVLLLARLQAPLPKNMLHSQEVSHTSYTCSPKMSLSAVCTLSSVKSAADLISTHRTPSNSMASRSTGIWPLLR
jgi:hypothetical protein